MLSSRKFLHLALVLILALATSGLGAGCAFASPEGNCCAASPADAPADSGMSGGVDRGLPELGATSGKSERLAAAVLASSPAQALHGLPAAAGTLAPSAPLAAKAALYLSHCAFLC